MQAESNIATWAIDLQLKLVRFSHLDACINIEKKQQENWSSKEPIKNRPYHQVAICHISFGHTSFTLYNTVDNNFLSLSGIETV